MIHNRPELSESPRAVGVDSAVRGIAGFTHRYADVNGGRMRAGFQHYGTLLADGRENRAAFRAKMTMPVLVLNGDKAFPNRRRFDACAKLRKTSKALMRQCTID